MSLSLFHRLTKLNIAIFVAISVALSEILTSLMSIMLQGMITPDYLITGGVVSLIVSGIVVYLLKQVSRLSEDNVNLRREIASRQEANEIVRLSEQKYQALIETTNTGFVLLDKTGSVLDANQEYIKFTGHNTLDEIKGRVVTEWTYAEDRERNAIEVKKCIERGFVRNLEIRYAGLNGSITPLEINATVIKERDEPKIMTMCRDITERKQVEEQLRFSAERLRLSMEASRQGWYDLNIQTGEIIVSDEYAQILGYDPIEFSTNLQTWIDGLHPEDRDVVLKTFDECVKTGETRSMEYRRRAKNGNWIWLLSTGKIVSFDAENRPLRMIGTHCDITERRIYVDALKKETLRRKILMDRSLDGIAIINQEHKVVEANQRFAEMLGYTLEEVLGLHTWDWEASMTEEEIRKNFADLTKTNTVFETHHRRKDGTIVDVEVSASGAKVGDEPMVFTISRDITYRKKEEASLKYSLSLLKATLESTADGILVVDDNGRITDFNEQFVKLWHIPRDILNRHDDEKALAFVLDQLENPEQFMTKVMELYADPEAISFDILAFKDGRIFERYSQPQKIDNKPVGRVWSFRDVTELRQAVEKIRELNADLSATLNAIPDLLFELDQHGTYLNIWAKNPELLARQKEILLGHTVTEMLAPDAAETVMAALLEAERNGQSFGKIIRLNLPNGTRWFELSTSKMIKTKESVNRFIMLSRDITERKLAQEALLVSEEKYRLVVENSNDAIVILQDGRAKFHNHQVMALSGYSEEEIRSFPFHTYIHDDDKAMVMEMHRKRLLGEDTPSIYSFRFINKKGEIQWVQVNAVLVTWESRPGVLVFLRDITVEKKLEEQLLQAQKMEAVGTLAGGIAHDFNNLLMGILGYTSLMLLKTEKTHPFYEKLKTVEGLVESGSELTKQLLGFARGGKYEVKPVDVNALIIKTSEIFERTKKEITIYKKLQEDLSVVEADAGQIEQVLLNLYVNAWQAMPSGGSLFLETQNAELNQMQGSTLNLTPGHYVKILVTDTGVGMDTETQKRIFEPFFTTKGIGKGTGLGLASAYGIIKNHDGIINVYSEKGYGTTFTIYLPASGTITAGGTVSQGSLVTGNETLLIVDDEPINIEAIKELLEMLGYEIMTARSGKEAIALYKEHGQKIQLVILDMIMPEMSGKETLIKLMELDRDVCVLLASGYSINGEAKEILDLGCKGFIQKPFRVEELSLKIRQVLNSRAS